MTTSAGGVPVAPAISTPLPSCVFSSACAPACIDIFPATSLIGASKGSPFELLVTVS